MDKHVTLITGGARSGKTRYALEAADDITPRTYIATAGLLDDEMRGRAARHQRERGTRWRTIEEPFELGPLVKDLHGLVVVDCLTLWLSNWMLRDDTQLDRQIDLLCAAFHSTLATFVQSRMKSDGRSFQRMFWRAVFAIGPES
jgi:adenosylcobinamide kinase / adenosylcobinamide-phosphate guanylyltransferase